MYMRRKESTACNRSTGGRQKATSLPSSFRRTFRATFFIGNPSSNTRQRGNLLRVSFRLGPFPVLFNQVHQSLHRFRLGNVEVNCFLSNVEIDLSRCSADVTEIGVRHLARPIHDT